MGKKIIIKNADFSANALEPGGIEWNQTTMAKPYIISNPKNTAFGTLSTDSPTSGVYGKMARLSSTIEVPAGKKLYLRVRNINDEIKEVMASMLYYGSAWSSDPTSALPATSIYHDVEDYRSIWGYENQGNNTVFFQATFIIKNVTLLDVNNYTVFYTLV